jgi:hypothetical protein
MSSVKQLIQESVCELSKYSCNNLEWYLIDDLMNIKLFSKGCNRSKPNFIKKYKFTEDNMIFGRINLDDQTIKQEETMISKKFSKRFINCIAVNECLVDNTSANMQILQAPPILDNVGFCFFKDDAGIEYNVEMRGERTKDKIYFSVNDLKIVLELNNLTDTLTHPKSAFIAIQDYNIFNVGNYETFVNASNKKMYLTFTGLIKAINRCNIGRGKDFVDYLDNIIFTTIAGDREQRIESSANIMQMQLKKFKTILAKCAGNISCLYLLNTGNVVNSEKVYKFGFTNDLKRRIGEHRNTFGEELKLTYFCLISEDKLSQAETEFKESVAIFNKKLESMPTQTELLFLNNISKKNVKNILSSISAKYAGDYQIITNSLQAEITNLKTTYKYTIALKNKEIEMMTEKMEMTNMICKEKLEMKDNEIKMKDIEIENMKTICAQSIKILELELALSKLQK